MNTKFIEARELIAKARESLRNGDKPSAWKLGEQAALLVPDMEDAWLILAASDPNPQEALAYAQKARQINPSSARASKAIQWTTNQPKQAQLHQNAFVVSPARIELPRQEIAQPVPTHNNSKFIYAAAIFGLLVCAVLAFAAYSAVTHPAFASILNNVSAASTPEPHWASVDVAKPSVTPIDPSAFAQEAESTATPRPQPKPSATKAPATVAPAEAATATPSEIPTEAPSATPAVTETPGAMAMEIVEDTPTSEFAVPTSSAPLPDIAKSGSDVRWIDVDLTNQAVYAYEGDVMVNSFIVSTGTWLTPTVTGQYSIYVKYRYANMHGPGYFLPNVPYVMYFYKGYGLHGTYWHNNFGHPMSHGCINLRTDDAGWLFNWASVGTLVNVHY
jgi:lipoprotein-anchoring transpeptidase ErfK/SrfK